MTSIHLTNAKGRDATVGLSPLKRPVPPKMGLPGGKMVVFRRYIAATEGYTDENLKKKFSADYSKNLIEKDPEVDAENIGKFVDQTQSVFLDGQGQVMFADPMFVELVLAPDGSEKERRTPVDAIANVNVESPVRWTGRKIPIKEAVQRYAFRRSLALHHVDGLTFDYLYEIAQELEDSKSIMLIGTGEKGAGALIFQANGRPYRGFLQGRTKGKSYKLTLHLSDMELKKPKVASGKQEHGE